MNGLGLVCIVFVLIFAVAPRGVYCAELCFNTTCPNDEYGNPQCCSEYGHCGNTTAYCGSGCLSGPCVNSTNPTNDRCELGPCNIPTLCCSNYFYCGSTLDHCGAGCRSGPCDSTAPTVLPQDTGACLPTNTCMNATKCCSIYGWCGDDIGHCGVDCVGGACWDVPKPKFLHEVAYNTSLSIGLGLVVGICILLGIAAAIVLAWKRSYFVRNGPLYCGVIIAGVIISYLAALMVLVRQNNHLCLAFPWFLGVGFNLVYGCLFIKTWVIYGMFRRAAQMKQVTVKPFYILKVLGVFLAVEVIFLLVWSLVDPPRVYQMVIKSGPLYSRYEIQCRTKSNVFWIIFLIYKGVWLLFGGVLCFLMRKVTKEYNRSKAIAYAIYNNVVIVLLAAPLSAVLENEKYAVMVVKVTGIICSFTFTLFILNFSIWYKIFYAKFDVVAGMLKSIPDSSTPSTTITTPTSSSYRQSTGPLSNESSQSKDAVYSADSASSPPSPSFA